MEAYANLILFTLQVPQALRGIVLPLMIALIAACSTDILGHADNFYLNGCPGRLQSCALNGKACRSAARHIINVEKSG